MAKNIDTIFYNADYLVVEYVDIIKSPYLILLNAIRYNDRLREILKMEEIDGLSDASLYEWYITRKHQNFLIDLNRYPDKISEEFLDEVLSDQMKLSDRFYSDAVLLNFSETLKILQNQKLVKDVIIYYPHETDFMKDDLTKSLGKKYTIMSDFEEVLKLAGKNSTYFLSDIEKLLIMDKLGYLALSTVSLPIEYRYNKKNMSEFKYNLEELYKKSPFKLSFFSSCTRYKFKQEEG